MHPFQRLSLQVTLPRLLGFVLGVLLATHLVLLGFFKISSEDTWWHLKQGELYVSSWSLPHQDPFAFTTGGRQWIHYSWLADILFYLVFRAAGFPGLVLLRLFLLLLIALLPLLALALVRVAGHLPARGVERPHRWVERIGALACLLVLTASIADQAFLTPRNPPGFGVRPRFFPEGATAFLERHRLDGRVFNSYKFGGYLIWRWWPANQVLIDGRYDAILFDEALLEVCIWNRTDPTPTWIGSPRRMTCRSWCWMPTRLAA